MNLRTLFVGLTMAASTLACSGSARAAAQPLYGPPPAWVDVATIPEAPPGEGALQTLLDDNQSRLGPDGDTYYNRRVRKVLKAEGLASQTTFSVAWNPAYETVTIHSLRIIRDGKSIDLLADAGKMLVLRRERGLERAMLDGRMSASQQVEGLQVGDIIDSSWTHTGRDPALGANSYDSEGLGFTGVAARYRVRLSWPEKSNIRWRVTPGFGEPIVSRRNGLTWVELDRHNLVTPLPPAGAPPRFRRTGQMETSGYGGWAEISRLMAPLYAKSAVIAPDSDLRSEIAAIARSTRDPKARAFAALQLVEEKTRYFFVGMGEGGYVPAQADETWARKFGDCKGKTALLLAILAELGVPAEPALVSLGGGDGMNERLPSMAAFNHVIVRADIEGKVYWLDGTRTGDKSGLDALRPPPHRWALPVRQSGAELEAIEVPPLKEPLITASFRLDASGGMDQQAAAKVVVRMVGDAANASRQSVARSRRIDLERSFRESFMRSTGWVTVEKVDWRDDVANDAFEIVLDGKADITWRKNPDIGVMEYRLNAGSTNVPSFPRRDAGPNEDAPFVVAHPLFIKTVTEVVLPDGGKGYTVRGPNAVVNVAGLEISRSSVIEGGVARFVVDLRSLQPEIPAAEAQRAGRVFRDIALDDSLIRAPQ